MRVCRSKFGRKTLHGAGHQSYRLIGPACLPNVCAKLFIAVSVSGCSSPCTLRRTDSTDEDGRWLCHVPRDESVLALDRTQN